MIATRPAGTSGSIRVRTLTGAPRATVAPALGLRFDLVMAKRRARWVRAVGAAAALGLAIADATEAAVVRDVVADHQDSLIAPAVLWCVHRDNQNDVKYAARALGIDVGAGLSGDAIRRGDARTVLAWAARSDAGDRRDFRRACAAAFTASTGEAAEPDDTSMGSDVETLKTDLAAASGRIEALEGKDEGIKAEAWLGAAAALLAAVIGASLTAVGSAWRRVTERLRERGAVLTDAAGSFLDAARLWSDDPAEPRKHDDVRERAQRLKGLLYPYTSEGDKGALRASGELESLLGEDDGSLLQPAEGKGIDDPEHRAARQRILERAHLVEHQVGALSRRVENPFRDPKALFGRDQGVPQIDKGGSSATTS